jgi:hypothetical protein
MKELDGGVWKTRIAEPKANGLFNWKGGHEARRGVYKSRARLKSSKARAGTLNLGLLMRQLIGFGPRKDIFPQFSASFCFCMGMDCRFNAFIRDDEERSRRRIRRILRLASSGVDYE